MTAYNLDDLTKYVEAYTAAGIAAADLQGHASAKPEVIDPLYREALRTAHLFAAAALALGLDPTVPHPVTEREVFRQIDAAGLWPHHPKRTKVKK